MERAGGVMQLRASGRDAFARLFHGNVPGHVRLLPLGPRPEDRVIDDALNERVVVDGVGLVARAEIEDAAAAARPTVPAAKDFPAFEPRDKDCIFATAGLGCL